MSFLTEPAKQVPVVYEADVCVVGGSCTGVFAAVRAARLGARVVIVEKQNRLGGVACSGLVNIWHSMHDIYFKERIVSGLSEEIVQRLLKQGAAELSCNVSTAIRFNPIALTYELDKLVKEHRIKTYLHTYYAGLKISDEHIDAIWIENKDGRGAISARFFIDATGDGDLMRDLEIEGYRHAAIQPPSSCFLLKGMTPYEMISSLVREHGAEVDLDDDWGWFGHVPGLEGISFRADNHVFGVDCSRADDRTEAEFEGRRRAFALEQLLKRYVSDNYGIVCLCSEIGIRETVHYRTRYMANAGDLLHGKRFTDGILNGTYPIDIHHSEDNGITFKYLDGSMRIEYGKGSKCIKSNWRDQEGLTGDPAPYYQVPFNVMVQEKCSNVIAAGRMLHADQGAFGALRVMINLNQMGEAAGVAAYLSIDGSMPVQQLDGVKVRQLLARGGSAL